jgi:hypothetical protein
VRSTIDIDPPSGRRNDDFAVFASVALTPTSRYARRQKIADAVGDDGSVGAPIMTTFDKREEGFERQFAHDEELKFKATARRDRLLGLWAAGKLGLSGTAADDYAKSVVVADIDTHDPVAKIRKDFDAKGVTDADEQIRRVMTELMARAVGEIKAGK